MHSSPRGGFSALGPALDKLIEVVEEENAVLAQQAIISHAGFTDRKNQALRELMAAQRSDVSAVDHDLLRPTLQRLADALQLNSRLLKHNIAAVGEVSDILVASLRELESDGTYNRGQASRNWR